MSWLGLDPIPQSEMAQRVRDLDWAATPLGPVEDWPPSLRQSAAMILVSGFPMAIRWGPQLVLIYNDAYREILGGKHPQALGRPLSEVWEEIYDVLGPLNEAILKGEHRGFFAEDHLWRVRRYGGSYEDARFTISYSPIPDEQAPHGIGGILTTCVETTKRIRTEERLRTLNETLEAEVAERIRERDKIWRVSEDLLGVTNFEGYFTSINPAWTALLGWSEDEIKRMHITQLRHPDDAPHSLAGRNQLAAGVPTVRMENRLRHKDGSWRWLYWTLTVQDGLIYVIGRHVTAEKEAAERLRRAQEQLAQSQKMEAIGQLTGGIAHDFNNLLMVVSGNAERLKDKLTDPRDRRSIEAIELASARGETLTRQLLVFSRRQALNPEIIDIGRRLQASRDLLSSSARGDIDLVIDIPGDTWPVSVDVPELELALVNVVVNARDAIAENGTIAITAQNIRLRTTDTADEIEGEFVALAISDTGCGIPPDLVPKVFEPFFTTKGLEKGTGLGLSQVYGFTRQSGGTVTIESIVGVGTTLVLYLPRSAALPAADPEIPAGSESSCANERVLLVEDNADVREAASMLLAQLGYRVVEVDNAAAALDVLGSGERFNLVFSDIVMPGDLNGIGLARQVRNKYPQMRVLLTTGYSQSEAAAQSGFPVLRKPYRLAALARAVSDVLGNPHPPA
ncbi:MAG TPA: ATP-binding protein [Stellaceae bacterium]|jgi:PAS domain S-box-containing protein|nr:ATP-binding protein [Stellaceae bacterium]